LLRVFLDHPQRILNRDQLLDLTQGREATPFDRSIDVQVSRLRRRLARRSARVRHHQDGAQRGLSAGGPRQPGILMRRLLPQSLFGRLLLFLTGGLVVAQLLSAAILLQDRDQALYHAIGGHVAQRIAAIVNLLDTLDDGERRRLVAALDLPPTRISLDLPWETIEPDERYHTALFRALLQPAVGS
jgi:hypothetical protein